MTTLTASPAQLSPMQTLTIGGILTGIRPEWDTPTYRHHLTRLRSLQDFPHAADFAHIVRAAVAYATTRATEKEILAGIRPADGHRWETPAFFAAAGPHWEQTR